jgi:hypothetical protein
MPVKLFGGSNPPFFAACERLGIKPTKRQHKKWMRDEGVAKAEHIRERARIIVRDKANAEAEAKAKAEAEALEMAAMKAAIVEDFKQQDEMIAAQDKFSPPANVMECP